MSATQISDEGLRLIASFEGFRSTPYEDPAGHCTVGYGFLLHFGNCTPAELAQTPISEEEGIAMLKDTVRLYVKEVVDDCRPLRQCELDALASLCYNIGRSGFARSSVRVAVNNNGNVAGAFRQYVKGTNGVIYPGLVRRREAEIALFFKEEGRMKYTDEKLDEVINNLAGTLATKADDQKVNDLANSLDVLMPNEPPTPGMGRLRSWFKFVNVPWPF